MAGRCLNCGHSTEGKYCSNCGQKTSTRRFSLRHFFAHDLVHGVFHLDKGFLYTLRELFVRPGHSIREYIQGKRINHFNYFTTVILILTIDYLLSKCMKTDLTSMFAESSGLIRLIRDYSKVIALLGVPFYALASYGFFRRSRQNYTEHLVLNVYMLCGWLSINLLLKTAMIFTADIDLLLAINRGLVVLTYTYVFVFYYQYFSAFGYKQWSLILRVMLISCLILLTKQYINYGLNEIGLYYFQ